MSSHVENSLLNAGKMPVCIVNPQVVIAGGELQLNSAVTLGFEHLSSATRAHTHPLAMKSRMEMKLLAMSPIHDGVRLAASLRAQITSSHGGPLSSGFGINHLRSFQ